MEVQGQVLADTARHFYVRRPRLAAASAASQRQASLRPQPISVLARPRETSVRGAQALRNTPTRSTPCRVSGTERNRAASGSVRSTRARRRVDPPQIAQAHPAGRVGAPYEPGEATQRALNSRARPCSSPRSASSSSRSGRSSFTSRNATAMSASELVGSDASTSSRRSERWSWPPRISAHARPSSASFRSSASVTGSSWTTARSRFFSAESSVSVIVLPPAGDYGLPARIAPARRARSRACVRGRRVSAVTRSDAGASLVM